MKKLMFLISITLMMFLAVACQGDDDESGLGEIDVDVVATVNGEDITADDLLENEQFLIDNYEMAGLSIEGNEEEIRESALNQIINTRIIVQNAINENLAPSDEELDEEYETFVAELKQHYDTDDVDEIFSQFDTNEAEVKEDLRTDITIQNYIDKNITVDDVSDEELQQAYDEYEEYLKSIEEEVPPFEDVSELLKQQVVNDKQTQAERELIERLRENSEIEVMI